MSMFDDVKYCVVGNMQLSDCAPACSSGSNANVDVESGVLSATMAKHVEVAMA